MFATEYETSASSQSSRRSSSTSLSNLCPALTADELALAECIEVIEAGVEDVIINKANEKEKKWWIDGNYKIIDEKSYKEFEKKCERANASKFWEYENGIVTIIELPKRDHEIAHGEFSYQFLSAFHNVPYQDRVSEVGSTRDGRRRGTYKQSDSSFVPSLLPKPAQYPSDSEGNPWPTVIVEVANTQTFASIIQKTTQFWLAPNRVEDVIILKLWHWDSNRDQNGTPLRRLTVQYCFVVSFHLFHCLIIVLCFGSAINSVVKQAFKCMGITNQLKWYELIEFGTIDRNRQPYGGCSAPGMRTLSISPHCIYKGCACRNPPLSPYPIANNNTEIPELREKLLRFVEVEAENARLKQIIEENARRDAENAELKSRVRELEARLALLEQGSAVDGMVLSFDQLNNDEEMVDFLDEALLISQDVTKIPEVTDMLTSEQDEQGLSQSYEASSESISSAYCILPKQPQVNASKLAYNLENHEDSSRSESCGIEELKSNQHGEVITKLDKNIIVEQELKQQVRELEARLALLEQGSAVDGMALSFGQTQNDKEVMSVVTVPTVDVPAPSNLDGNDEEMVDFLDEVCKKSISNEIRKRRWEKKQRDQEALLISQDVTKIPEVTDMLTSEQDEQGLS
ncbi:12868_t:CDS:10 [Entrophospora sp. SA101]|nr:12868_t:CDS:10 [Entrophospora sp. SA101]